MKFFRMSLTLFNLIKFHQTDENDNQTKPTPNSDLPLFLVEFRVRFGGNVQVSSTDNTPGLIGILVRCGNKYCRDIFDLGRYQLRY